ncbi:DUF3616 domain-containing protein [Aquabacter spiritensis]|uniref:Uncharacterized protein DUF3616 n=1 Tax=Aquabacter spiritensis TaxID=933073 RepID=A0A4R3LT14_9HYPH|nr:DUF3616 domain-containing protein [Aquabacter spiritensis]TCT03521.1 uncharacterized protein DUF3616 [Aquabacter spiritensis]
MLGLRYRFSPAAAVSGVLACVLASVCAHAATDRYDGICDASAAIALDANHFVVAEDEHDVLFVYRFGQSAPVGAVDLVDVLGNRSSKGKVKEADIEGAARIGTRIYWIASHGRDSKGDREPTRQRLFATDIKTGATPPTVVPAGTPYKSLLDDLLAALNATPDGAALVLAAAAKQAPEAPAGLNIEGLAATPRGDLLIGFRNPRPGDKALIVPLTNAAALMDGAKPAVFGAPILLDLGGRGIRSIERVGAAYVIVAGPFGDRTAAPGGDFALYRWDGPGTAPRPIAADFGAFRPEALFQADGALYLLSDDGGEPVGGVDCKKAPQAARAFRGLSVPLP